MSKPEKYTIKMHLTLTIYETYAENEGVIFIWPILGKNLFQFFEIHFHLVRKCFLK